MKHFYFTDPIVGQGLPILEKNGAIAKQRLMDYISGLLLERNYTPLATPHIGNLVLFSKSGHYPYYKDSMFPEICDYRTEKSGNIVAESFALKPMNCPFHIMAYEKLGIVSYRDLPIKFYEFGQVYRYEDSGALNGLFRLRSFTQDDGHLFCSMNQIPDVVNECIDLVKLVCEKAFLLKITAKLSIRGDDSKKYVGSVDNWGASEDILKSICYNNFGEDYQIDVGGAAFYGPKIDFVAKDKLNREWQLGTIQLDFNLPELFDINYIESGNVPTRPVLVHRALLGSLERFLGILLENDLLPLHLQPFNMGVIWIGENRKYFENVVDDLKENKIYPTVIESPANLKEAMVQLYNKGITNITIIGKKEESEHTINYNKRSYTRMGYFLQMETEFTL